LAERDVRRAYPEFVLRLERMEDSKLQPEPEPQPEPKAAKHREFNPLRVSTHGAVTAL